LRSLAHLPSQLQTLRFFPVFSIGSIKKSSGEFHTFFRFISFVLHARLS
jgi:hypothetical protein